MIDLTYADQVAHSYAGDKGAVVKALQAIQEHYNYLPREAMEALATGLEVPLSQILRVATFYKAFSLEPRGKHCLEVCLGTACHVRGGARLMAKMETELGVSAGETTDDGDFTLGVVRCMGCCSMAPAVRVGDDTYGRLRVDKVSGLLRHYREEGEE